MARRSADVERTRCRGHDHVALFEMGAHPFLTLTLWIAMFERDYDEPLAMQLDYAAKLAHVTLPYPDIARERPAVGRARPAPPATTAR